ncbi:hypothetical protein OVS_04360 [Mycoplasma ovis str. Michigan]|uniref:Uncharacterized protein n=1 Tax=Mycoplasma ovis str. Michigan TaxID=1415773 RepID=A0ABM5P2J1_9MOLU|nr:hypothetical protein [Mycoplasma ovis]AHC40599.1 hypothetical protein OVS_04360 [Mycoplasma ovis str. Michigan]
MTIIPKVVTIITTVGGGMAGIPLLFQNSDNTVNTSSPAIPSNLETENPKSEVTETSKQETVSASEPEKNQENDLSSDNAVRGNCKIIVTSKEKEDILWEHSLKLSDDYLTILCNNTNSNDEKGDLLPNEWVGLFPKKVISSDGSLGIESTLDIEATTTVLDPENYRTIFSGSRLSPTSLTGEWSKIPTIINKEEVVVVNIKENIAEIFLLFKDKLIFKNTQENK